MQSKEPENETEPWFCNSPVGHNILLKKLVEIFAEAGLSTENVHNHSLRATAISRLYAKGMPKKEIMERSGHFSIGGVRPFERTTEMQMKQVSDMIVVGKGIASVKTKSVDNDTENDGKEVNFRTCKDAHLTLHLTKLSS